MTDNEIQTRIIEIVAAQTHVDQATLTRDTRFTDLKIESLDMVQILFVIEDTFDIYVPQDDQTFRLGTLGQACDGVKKLMAAKHPST